MQAKNQLNDMINDLPVANGLCEQDLRKISDQIMLSMYLETKELMDWYGLPGIVGCLSDLANENMFVLSRENADLESNTMRDQTQLVLGLIKYLTRIDHYIKNIEYFRASYPAKPSL